MRMMQLIIKTNDGGLRRQSLENYFSLSHYWQMYSWEEVLHFQIL